MTYFYSDYGMRVNQDLHCYTCGVQECPPGHHYGPTIRKGYIFYLITTGSGLYTIRNKTYLLHAGDGFLIVPGEIFSITASSDDPWTYWWAGFSGGLAKSNFDHLSINSTKPIFKFDPNEALFKDMQALVSDSKVKSNRNLLLTASLYRLLYQLREDHPAKPNTSGALNRSIVEDSLYYIHTNYGQALQVDTIAGFVHVHRAQLYKLFKRYLDVSPQEYIINYRMSRAKDFLAGTSWPIGVVASSSGYPNQFLFSKTFKERVHQTPTEYRESHHDMGTGREEDQPINE